MNSSNSFFDYLTGLSAAFLLILIGYFSVFKTEKLISFVTKLREKTSLFCDNYKKMPQQKWFYLNMKFCGVIFIVVGIILLVYTINEIMGTK
jgi:hypothetical protein